MSKHAWKFQRNKNNEFVYVKAKKAVVFSLPPIDLKVYQVLLAHRNPNGLCFPSIPTIADGANLDEKTVKASRNRLRDLGLLTWIVDKSVKNSCLYDFPLEDGADAEQAMVLGKLRSAHMAALSERRLKRSRRRANRRTAGRGNKRTGGRGTKRP